MFDLRNLVSVMAREKLPRTVASAPYERRQKMSAAEFLHQM